MDTRKIEFARESLNKSKKFQDDPFVEFIVLWIGLNALYSEFAGREIDKLKCLLTQNQKAVIDILENSRKILLEIEDYINLTSQHNNLSVYLKTRRSFITNCVHDKSVEYFAEFLSEVRNNMFHAGKLWNKEEEGDLLKMVNSILFLLVNNIANSSLN
ncbi:hypothetical protein ACFL2C_02545 [Patescibacteria group bacterium]